MQTSPPFSGQRWAVFCLAAFISSLIVYHSAKLCLAWYWGNSNQVSERLRAVRMEPDDADAWARLGELVWTNSHGNDISNSISYFRRAARADPYSANIWLSLAAGYEAAGDPEHANAAFRNAQRVYPISARVAWQYGNFLLRRGQTDEALSEFHQAVATEPSLAMSVVSALWDANPDVDLILRAVSSAGEDGYWQALNFFSARHQAKAGLESWSEILNAHGTTPLKLNKVFPFLDEMIAEGRAGDVERVWSEALRASNWPETPPLDHSLVWNGGFDIKIANGGLDWRIEQVPGAVVSFDSTVHRSGTRSLRVDFTGGINLDFANVYQIVPVEARASYDFQAYLKTKDISTDSGICFELIDAQHPQELDDLTPSLMGTNPWTAATVKFATGADTHFLEIRLRRLPSQMLDNKLSGTVWVDDVTLVTASPAATSKP